MTPIHTSNQDADIRPAPSQAFLLAQDATDFLRQHGFGPDGRSKKECVGRHQDAHYRSTSTPTGRQPGFRRGR